MSRYYLHVYCDDTSTRSGMHHGKQVKVIQFEYDDATAGEFADGGTPEARWFVDNAPPLSAQQAMRRASQRVSEARDEDGFSGGLAKLVEFLDEELGDNPRSTPVTHQTVYDDEQAVVNGYPGGPAERPFHVKYVMTCSLCGLNLQRRHNDLVPVLERLRTGGVTHLSLAALAGMIG